MKIAELGFRGGRVCSNGALRPAALGQTYYATTTYSSSGENTSFGTINASGQTTPIGSGLSLWPDSAPILLESPAGTLYAFTAWGVQNSTLGPWGTISPQTGVFTQMGNFGSAFEGTGNGPPALAFDSAGDLIAVGLGPGYVPTVLDLNVTTGAYTTTTVPLNSTAGMLAENAWDLGGMGSIVTVPNQGTYYATTTYSSSGENTSFGTINASGQTTPIGGGLNFAPYQGGAPILLESPTGTLYAFWSERKRAYWVLGAL